MRTPEEIESFSVMLEAAHVSRSNRLAHNAMDNYKAGGDALTLVNTAAALETQNRTYWLNTCLDPWCKRHGLTWEQALSVAFDDSPFDPANPQKDRVTIKDLFWGGGQQNDFSSFLMRPSANRAAAPSPAPAVQAQPLPAGPLLSLGQQLKASLIQHEDDARIASSQAADKAAQIAFREKEFVVKFFEDMKAQITEQISQHNKAVVISLRAQARGPSPRIDDLLGLSYTGQRCLNSSHRFYGAVSEFFAWGKAQGLKLDFQHDHDGVGIESWFNLVAVPLA